MLATVVQDLERYDASLGPHYNLVADAIYALRARSFAEVVDRSSAFKTNPWLCAFPSTALRVEKLEFSGET